MCKKFRGIAFSSANVPPLAVKKALKNAPCGESVKSITLDMLPLNACARVVGVTYGAPARLRLLEMGFVPGTAVITAARSPRDKTLRVRLRGFELALQSEDAKNVIVTAGEGCNACGACGKP